MIRAAAEGSEPDPLIDLSQIDFDGLAAKFAGRKRAETDRLAALLKQRADRRRDPQPDPLRPGRAHRGADRRLQRRQRQHRRVPAPAHRAVEDADRRGTARCRRRADRGRAGDLRPAHQARAGAHRRRTRRRQGQRQAAARAPARQARAGLAPQGRDDRRRPVDDPRRPRRRPARGPVPAGALRRQGPGRLRPRRHRLRRRRLERLRRRPCRGGDHRRGCRHADRT